MKLGDVLKKWRVMSQLTLDQVSTQMNLTVPTLCRVESGKPMDGKTLAAIMGWLTMPEAPGNGKKRA